MPSMKWKMKMHVEYFEFGMRDGIKWWVREVNSVLGKYAWGVTLHNGSGDGGWADTPETALEAAKERIDQEVKRDG